MDEDEKNAVNPSQTSVETVTDKHVHNDGIKQTIIRFTTYCQK